MLRRVFLVIFLLWGSGGAFPLCRVAVFDYDDRSGEAMPQSRIITEEIRKIDPTALIIQYNGGSSESRSMALAAEIEAQGYDLVIVITSDALKIVKRTLLKTPFLFTNVNNPLFIGYSSLERPGGNSSGVTYYVPIPLQIDFFREVVPSIKSIGFIFDDGALSRVHELRASRDYCAAAGLRGEFALIKSSAEIEAATAQLLAKKVDGIVLTSSGTVYNQTSRVVKLTTPAGVPVFSYNKTAVTQGALAALSSDYTIMNTKLLPPMIRDVMKKKINPGTLPVAHLDQPLIYLNLRSAKAMGLTIPYALVSKAAELY